MSIAFFQDDDRVFATLADPTCLEAVLDLVRHDNARLVSLQPRANVLEPLVGHSG
jgi:hypothetical protein